MEMEIEKRIKRRRILLHPLIIGLSCGVGSAVLGSTLHVFPVYMYCPRALISA